MFNLIHSIVNQILLPECVVRHAKTFFGCVPNGLHLQQGFLTIARLIFWTRKFFLWVECPVHCRTFSSILDLYPLYVSTNPMGVTIKTSLDIAKCPGEGGMQRLDCSL